MSLFEATCGRFTLRVNDPNGKASFSDETVRCAPFKMQWGSSSSLDTGGILTSNATILLEDTTDQKIRGVFADGSYTKSDYPVEIEGPWGPNDEKGIWHGFVEKKQLVRPTSFRIFPRQLRLRVHDGATDLKDETIGTLAERNIGAVIKDLRLANTRDVEINWGAQLARGELADNTSDEIRRFTEYPASTADNKELDNKRYAFDHIEDLAERLHMLVWHEPTTERWHAVFTREVGQSKTGTEFTTAGGWSLGGINTTKDVRSIDLDDFVSKKKAYEQAVVANFTAPDTLSDYIRDASFSHSDGDDFDYWEEDGDVTNPGGGAVNLGVGSGGAQEGTVRQELIHKGQANMESDLDWTSTDQSGGGTGELTVKLEIKKDGDTSWTTLQSVDGLATNTLGPSITDAGRLRIVATGKNASWNPASDGLKLYKEGTTTDVEEILYDDPVANLNKTLPVTRDFVSSDNAESGTIITRYGVGDTKYRSAFEYRCRVWQGLLGGGTWHVNGTAVKGVHTPIARLQIEQDETRVSDRLDFVAVGGREVDLFNETTTLNDISV